MCKKSDDKVIRTGLGEVEMKYMCASFKRYVEISWSGCYNEGSLIWLMFTVQSFFSWSSALIISIYCVPYGDCKCLEVGQFPQPIPYGLPPFWANVVV